MAQELSFSILAHPVYKMWIIQEPNNYNYETNCILKRKNTESIYNVLGTAVAHWLRCCARNRKVAGSIRAGINGFFIDIKSFRSHYGPGVDSASNRNEYREYFLGVKSGRYVRLTTLPRPCAVVTKSERDVTSWNPLGLSRPVMGLLYLFLYTMFKIFSTYICWINI